MTKDLLTKETWTVRDTEIEYHVYKVKDRNTDWYEVEMLNETFRLKKDQAGKWTDLEGSTSQDIQKWGEVIEMIDRKRSVR